MWIRKLRRTHVNFRGGSSAAAAAMPAQGVVKRPGRQQDYSLIPSQCPLVIDNGAYFCRVG